MTIKQYLTQFIAEYQHVDGDAFVDVEAEDISSLYLMKVEEGHFHEKESEEQTECIHVESNSYELQNISSVIQNEQQLIILGNPGSGKSTTLIHEALNMAKSYLRGDSQTVPVYVALKNIISLKDFEKCLNIEQQQVDNIGEIPFYNHALFLDGLNELSPHVYDTIISYIKHILQVCPDCKLILSSRKYGYTNQLSIPQYELQAFDEENIGSYIKKRTGNIQLLTELRKDESLFSLCSTPLLLKMVVDTWLSTKHLPDQVSALYQEFIDNQIKENLHLNNPEKQMLIHVMSVLAFKLRDTGFISDSTEEMKSIISYYAEEEKGLKVGDVTHMGDLLMRSGLLVIYDRGNGFQYISFLHETFQEYFCSIYVAHQYLSHQNFGIDIANSSWKETMRMAMEIIVPQLGKHQVVDLLKTTQQQFIAKNTSAIDMHLVRYIEILGSCTSTNPIIGKWLEQYTLFNMNNYMAQPMQKRSKQEFMVIIEAITMMRSKLLYQMLFRDLNGWMKEWLYDDEELDNYLAAPLKKSIWKKERIVTHYACLAKDKPLFLKEIIQAEKSNRMFPPVIQRLQDVKQRVIMSIHSLEAKRIFEETNLPFFLLMSKDQNAIMQTYDSCKYDINMFNSEQREFIRKKYTQKGCLSLLEFYYNWILPKYEHLDEEQLQIELIADIRHCPKLMDSLLFSQFWENRTEWLTKVIYRVPEKYWTDSYKSCLNTLLTKKLQPKDKHEEKPLSYKLVSKGKLDNDYIYDIAPGQGIKQKAFYRLTESCTTTPNFKIVMMLQITLKKYNDGEKEWIKNRPGLKKYEWKRIFEPLQVVEKMQEGDAISYLFLIDKVLASIKTNSIVIIGDDYFFLAKTQHIYMILSRKEEDTITLYPIGWNGTDWTKKISDYYYLIPRSKLLYNKQDAIENMGRTNLEKRGWLGYSPKAIRNIPDSNRKFYLITQKKGENRYEMIQANKSEYIVCDQKIDYFTCQEGDVVMESNHAFWKIVTLDPDLSIYGFERGTVIKKRQRTLWIKALKDDKEYTCHEQSQHEIGQEVTFWPTNVPSNIASYHMCAFLHD